MYQALMRVWRKSLLSTSSCSSVNSMCWLFNSSAMIKFLFIMFPLYTLQKTRTPSRRWTMQRISIWPRQSSPTSIIHWIFFPRQSRVIISIWKMKRALWSTDTTGFWTKDFYDYILMQVQRPSKLELTEHTACWLIVKNVTLVIIITSLFLWTYHWETEITILFMNMITNSINIKGLQLGHNDIQILFSFCL